MYTTFFGLRELPFPLANDLHFFYSTAAVQKAEASIVTALRERRGLILLTGEPGTGKTTLLRRISGSVETQAEIVSLPFSALTFDDILTYLCSHFSIIISSDDPFTKVLAIQEYLRTSAEQGSSTVVCIDEAQNLHKETLDRLRLLLHLKGPNGRLLQILLAGQPPLEAKLAHPDLCHIQQYVTVHCRLHPLSHEDVKSFIHHRLGIAGCNRSDLFSSEAIERIADYSQHVPRLINVICDNALIAAYLTGTHTVSLDIVEEVAQNLLLDDHVQAGETEGTKEVVVTDLFVQGPVQSPQGWSQRWLHNLAWTSVGILFAWLSSNPRIPWFPFTTFSDASRAAILGSATSPPKSSPGSTASSLPVSDPRDDEVPAKQHSPSLSLIEPRQGNKLALDLASVPTPGVRQPLQPPIVTTPPASTPVLHESKTSLENSHAIRKLPAATAADSVASPPSLPAPVLTGVQRHDKQHLHIAQDQMILRHRTADEVKEALFQLGLQPTRAAFFRAVEANNTREVDFLLTARAPINDVDEHGWTALMIAARDNHPDLVGLLLARGAAVNAKNKMGETALIQAAHNDNPAIVQMLLDRGAAIDTKNNQGWTALMYAASNGHRLTVETLLNKGANPRVKDKDGRTASMYAARQRSGSPYEVQVRDPAMFRNRLGRLDAGLQRAKRQDYSEIASLLKQAEIKK